jgi:hypothetical protein
VSQVLVSIERYRPEPAVTASETPFGIAVGIGAVAMVGAGVIAAMIPAAYPGWRFGVIALAVFLFAALSFDQRALAIVMVIGALIFNGFLEDRLGQLSWHGSDDLWRLLLLVMVSAWGLATGEGYRYVQNLRRRWLNPTTGYPTTGDPTVGYPTVGYPTTGDLPAESSIEKEKHGA